MTGRQVPKAKDVPVMGIWIWAKEGRFWAKDVQLRVLAVVTNNPVKAA